MRFVEGEIEDLAAAGVGDASVDLVISNCVVRVVVRVVVGWVCSAVEGVVRWCGVVWGV